MMTYSVNSKQFEDAQKSSKKGTTERSTPLRVVLGCVYQVYFADTETTSPRVRVLGLGTRL